MPCNVGTASALIDALAAIHGLPTSMSGVEVLAVSVPNRWPVHRHVAQLLYNVVLRCQGMGCFHMAALLGGSTSPKLMLLAARQ